MELHETKSLTFKALQEFNGYDDDTTYFPHVKQIDNVRTRVEELMYVRNPNSPRADTRFDNVTPAVRMTDLENKYFNESFNDFIRQGILIWGKEVGDPYTGSHPWFTITSYGKKVLESGEISPHDPHDYLARLKKVVPDVDNIVMMYVEESIQCFIHENLMAASVMLGVASEAAFYRLLESFKKSIQINQTVAEKAGKLDNRMNIADKFKVVYDEIQNNKD